MKVISFHSCKGGVGRTLALANFAYALAEAGKKVLIVDCDFSAPGVNAKFNMPTSQGLLEYYQIFDAAKRAANRDENPRLWQEKLEYMCRSIIQPKDTINVFVLPAGNYETPLYWGFYSSHRFRSLYYFTESQLSSCQSESNSGNTSHILNQQAFILDKVLLEEACAGVDYLLVDAKGDDDGGIPSILFWSDKVVHFFPQNQEGLEFFAMLHVRIKSFNLNMRKSNPIGILPVISRISTDEKGEIPETPYKPTFDDFDDMDSLLAERIDFFLKRYYSNFGFSLREAPPPGEVWKSVILLSESRDLERVERVYFRPGRRANKFKSLPLTHDYISLFARLADPPNIADFSTQVETEEASSHGYENSENAWYDLLGVDPLAKIKEQVFFKHEREGIMLNSDGEVNIALRVKTLHLMLGNILDKLTNEEGERIDQKQLLVEEALFDGGFKSGISFGQELIDKFFRRSPKRFSGCRERLEFWAQFDTGSGFGDIKIIEPAPVDALVDSSLQKFECLIFVKNNSFNDPRIDEETGYDLKNIFRGYIHAVITYCFRDAGVEKKHVVVEQVPSKDWSSHAAVRLRLDDLDTTMSVYKVMINKGVISE